MSQSLSTRVSPHPATFATSLTSSGLIQSALVLLTIWLAFFNATAFDPEKQVVGLDAPVLLKLLMTGLAGLCGLYGFIAIARVRQMLLSLPGLWLTLLAATFVVASVTSITPIYSIGATLGLWSVLLFMATMVAMVGPFKTVQAVLLGIALFVAGSWVAYLAVPELGVLSEAQVASESAVRMAGLSHPNALGQFSALAAGLIFVLWRQRQLTGPIYFGIFAMSAGALALSISRASLIALLVATGFVYRDRIFRFLGPIGSAFALLVLCGSLLAAATTTSAAQQLMQNFVQQVTKSGELEEITTLTGRTEIWMYAVNRLAEKPWTGFGPATSKVVLEDHVNYTHNLWLHIFLSSGILGGLILIALTIGRLFQAVVRPARLIDFIIIFTFVNGLVENVIFEYVPGASTMLFCVAVLWRSYDYFEHAKGDRS